MAENESFDQEAYAKGKKTVCVDLDGVILKYDRWRGIDHFGEPIPGAKEFLEELRKVGRVVIFTTRCNVEVNGKEIEPPRYIKGSNVPFYQLGVLEQKVLNHLLRHQLPFDDIWIQQGKPLAAAYIDDRAVECRPSDSNNNDIYFSTTLGKVKGLLEDAK